MAPNGRIGEKYRVKAGGVDTRIKKNHNWSVSECTYTIDRASLVAFVILILFIASMGGLFSKSKETRINSLKGASVIVGGGVALLIILRALGC